MNKSQATNTALSADLLVAALTEAESKTLAAEDKWFAIIRAAIEGEVQRLTQQLTGRVKILEERYARSRRWRSFRQEVCKKVRRPASLPSR